MQDLISYFPRNYEDRGIAKKRSIELLEKGGNLLIYPEGAWNISPNLPVMKLYKGAVNIAVKTKADLIPIAIEQVENHFYVSIGKNIITSDMENIDTNLLNQTLTIYLFYQYPQIVFPLISL